MIPQHVTILGTAVDVIEETLKDECGDTKVWKRQIRIDPKLLPDVKVETFYHEVAHFFLIHSGYGELLDDKIHEAIVQCMGVALTDFITHNYDKLPRLEVSK